jgi:hypothetical protein
LTMPPRTKIAASAANTGTCREFELNLPIELSPQQRLDWARDFLRREVVDK